MNIEIDEATGYVKEPLGEEGGIFEFLEEAYGVERTESLMIGINEKLVSAAQDASQLMEMIKDMDDPRYKLANEIESKIDGVMIELGLEDN
jgi:hypothetical protein